MSGDLTDDVGLFEPLRLMSESEYFRRDLLEGLGWDVDTLGDGVVQDLLTAVDEIGDAVATVAEHVEDPPDTLEEFAVALEEIGQLAAALHGLETTALDPDLTEQLASDIVSFLVTGYLQKQHPALTYLAVVLTLVTPPDPTDRSERLTDASNEVVRYETARTDLKLDTLGDLLTDPHGTLEDEYWGDGTREDIAEGIQTLVRRVGGLFESLGVESFVQPRAIDRDLPPGVAAEVSAENEVASVKLRFDADPTRFTITLVAYVDDTGAFTAVVMPSATASLSETVSSWELSGSVEAGATAVLVTGSDVRFVGDGSEQLSVEVGAVRISDEASGASVTIGGREGTRLEIGRVSLTGDAVLAPGRQEYGLLATADDSSFVLSPAGADNFLQLVMPEDGMGADFDLGLGWSTERAVYVQGGGGLEVDLPVRVSLGEALSLDSLRFGIDLEQFEGGGGSIPVYFTGTIGTKLGPVSAVVENIGLSADVEFPEDNSGNLGPVDVTLAFEPPDGAGLSIDASAVVGGGYLSFDPEKERYSGTLQLQIGSLTLEAIGLLTTRLPDGRDGFSLLVIITGEFPPMQLGFGFTLNGLGGLLGVNRETNVEVLRSGLRDGTTKSVLFPEDPMRNAPRIVSDLRSVFPPTGGRHVFGPMARVGWGTPTIMTADIGVLISLPSPVKLVVLGRLHAALPDDDAALVVFNMDAIGAVDFGAREGSIDATLYDSRVVAYTLTGDMAMRTNWGDDPDFALSVGGFHPRFDPPEGFPPLGRIALTLGSGNPRIRWSGYFAITSNTVQAGARVELYAGAGKFSVSGHLGFDALFQFDPFKLLVDISAGFAIKLGGTTLLSATLKGSLEGPSPWHVRGKVKFKIWPISFKVSVDATFGERSDPEPLPPADVLGKVVGELRKPSNWSAQLPEGGDSVVTLRDIDRQAGKVLAHPLGTLQVRQQVAPLNVEIDTFGNARPATYTKYTIESVTVAGQPQQGEDSAVREQFAPAQFFEMSDAEKLSGPSFERYPAGRTVGNTLFAHGGQDDPENQRSVGLEYETTIVDRREAAFPIVWDRLAMPRATARALVPVSAVARGPLRTTGEERFAGTDDASGPTGVAASVTVTDTTFVVARSEDLRRVDVAAVPDGGTTKREAEDAMAEVRESADDTEYRVVATHEASGPEVPL